MRFPGEIPWAYSAIRQYQGKHNAMSSAGRLAPPVGTTINCLHRRRRVAWQCHSPQDLAGRLVVGHEFRVVDLEVCGSY